MYLKKLNLLNFKNYKEADLELEGNIHYFVGKNGSGKTNLLDAIHYLAFTKSALNPSDIQNITHGEAQFIIQGEFQKGDHLHVVNCSYRQGEKKIMAEDRQAYAKFSSHIGKYPVVLVAPNDIELIWNGSEGRRKFFDNLISQISHDYLEQLMIYTHHLKQRNGLLRIFSERGNVDPEMLEAYDQKLVPSGNYIFQKRKEILKEFHPLFENHYRFLADDPQERVEITYRSELEAGDFEDALRKNRQRDILLQRTGAGIHRDDFLFTLNGAELKRLGSQGQQKSFLIALRLAEFQGIAESKKLKPLLLLDDIFDKLDDLRINKLIQRVADNTFGQLFITDARTSRSRDLLEGTGIKAQLFRVEKGEVRLA